MTEKQKHIHKYKKLKYKSGNAVYFCTLPDCTFKISVPLSLGKRTICHRCGESFIMNEYSIRLVKPHCEKCHQTKIDKNKIQQEETRESLKVDDLSLSDRLTRMVEEAQQEEEEL